MSDIVSILQQIGFNTDNLNSNWGIHIYWSSCDHDNWLIRRNKLKDNDIRLDVGIASSGWKITLEAKHNLYRLVWKESGTFVTADLPKYSRMTRWPTLDNFLQLPDLILQLEQLSEFKQKQQVFSRQVKLNAHYINLDKDLDQQIFKDWLGSAADSLLLPSDDIDFYENEDSTEIKPYPAATTEPGYPFADNNFKLAVMNSLLDSQRLNLGKKNDFYRFIHSQYPESKKDTHIFIKSAKDYLSRYSLTNEQLSSVNEVYLDASSEIYYYIDPYWDGESLDFCVESLQGIEHCPDIKEFSDCEFSTGNLDLSPLATLSELEKISLDLSSYKNTQSLLSITSLKGLDCYIDAVDAEIVNALKNKGVKVKTFS